jgi:hypothetical protein
LSCTFEFLGQLVFEILKIPDFAERELLVPGAIFAISLDIFQRLSVDLVTGLRLLVVRCERFDRPCVPSKSIYHAVDVFIDGLDLRGMPGLLRGACVLLMCDEVVECSARLDLLRQLCADALVFLIFKIRHLRCWRFRLLKGCAQ